MRILVTRADDVASATAERVKRLGHTVVTIPMTQIVATDAAPPAGPFAATIATSARALRLIHNDALRGLTQLALYAVGQQTACVARTRGFADVIVADGDSRSLVALIGARNPGKLPLLYLAGHDRKRLLEAALFEFGFPFAVVAVYRALEMAALTKDQVASLASDRIDAVLHYSRRSTEIYCRLMMSAGLEGAIISSKHYCISADAARPLERLNARDVEIAAAPTEVSLLQRL
jgi:uroporphyrinogen-III synthase